MISLTKNWKKATHLTHTGKFHTDEVFSTAILSKIHPNLTLSRVQEIDEKVDRETTLIYDIGFGPFDHHQKGGNGSRKSPSGHDIKYSSCGLIWREFGISVITSFAEHHPKLLGYDSFNLIPDTAFADIFKEIDENFIQFIDADDNGQELLENPSYLCHPVFLPDIINLFNPAWNEDVDPDKSFLSAVTVAEQIIDRVLTRACANYASKSIIEAALDTSENGILILDRYLTYEPALLSSTHEKAKDILFVIYPSNRNGYNVRAVPVAPGSFKNRKDLPAAWAGLSGEDLADVTGVPTATFCHNGRFLAVATTFDDALALARLALK